LREILVAGFSQQRWTSAKQVIYLFIYYFLLLFFGRKGRKEIPVPSSSFYSLARFLIGQTQPDPRVPEQIG
jgi:hypothetical protein